MQPYFEQDGITIYHGDLREVAPLLGAVADVVIADPTYQQTSLAWDRWVPGWPAAVRAALVPSGSMWCFGTLRMFMLRAAEFERWRFAQDVVWEKHNGSSFHADRFKRVHEQVAHFYPEGVRWADVYRAPQFTNDARKKVVRRKQRPPHTGHIEAGHYTSEDGGPRLMRSVLQVRSCHGSALNPTQKPTGIIEPLIRFSCPPGGVVLSPFMGSGSDLAAAQAYGVRAIGIDVRESECEIAARRLSALVPA